MKSDLTKKQKFLRLTYTAGLLSLVLVVALSLSAGGTLAANLFATAPGLGAADSFAVLAAQSASSANTTTIWGDLGLYPGLESSRTGPWVIGGDEYFGPGTLAETAQQDALTAYNNLAGQASDGTWSSTVTNPPPGVYTAADSPTFTGTLTLNGDYDDVWVFQISDSLTFDGDVVMEGNAQACNVFWQVDVSATIASGSNFVGTLIVGSDLTLVSGATVSGRIISLNGAITVDNNTISFPPCQASPAATQTAVAATQTAIATLPAATQTAIAATQTLQAATPTAQATATEQATEDVVNPTATPSLPDTGGDLDEPGPQIIRFSLGALGLTLILFGLFLSRRTQKTDR